MSLLAGFEVIPFNGQVEIGDPNARNYPQWETGEEAVVALPQCVAVATRGDAQGSVVIEVWKGALEVEEPVSHPLYDGDLVLTENKVMVGNTVGNDLHELAVAAGSHRLRVYVAPPSEPARTVYFLLD